MPSKTPLRMSPLTAAEKKVSYDSLPTHRQIAMLEWCLWKLATIFEHYEKKKDKSACDGLLGLYEKLERELVAIQSKESTMQRVKARLEAKRE